MKDPATTVMDRCNLLGSISEEEDRLTRSFGSGAMRDANDIVSRWMKEAGMNVREDPVNNLIGRYEGEGDKTLLLGSHLDTVRDAGKYDGILGVLVALACVQRLHDRGERLPYAVEVVAFSDEEGLRFGTALGSYVYTGTFHRRYLEDLEDHEGVKLVDAIRAAGGDSGALESSARKKEDLLGYCEVHIEQGPVLEREGLPVGVVSAITGLSRIGVSFTGEAGHAGTVPMEARRDSLCAAAEFVLEAESAAKSESGAVATVGEISELPDASNVIPEETALSLDLRHQDDAVRERLVERLKVRAEEIAASRGCEFSWQVRQEGAAVPTDPGISALLERAVEESGVEMRRLPSGAGHDAVQVAGITRAVMLFMRCKEGISHNPAESVEKEDVGVAIEVMDRFLRLVAEGNS